MLDFRFFLTTYAALGKSLALPTNRKIRKSVHGFSTLKTMQRWPGWRRLGDH